MKQKKKEIIPFEEHDFVKHTLYNYSGKVITSNKEFTIVDTGSLKMVGTTSAFKKVKNE